MGSVYLTLWQSVWRQRGRTAAALGLLLLAKMAAVLVPLSLKGIVDTFSAAAAPGAGPASDARVVLTLPVFLLLAYAVLRFAATLFTELRDLVFARVTLRTVSEFAQTVYLHLMHLSPRFHALRSTGMLIRDVERGTAGIAFLLGAGLFTVLPTLVEFIAVLVVMIAAGYSGWFTVAIVVTFFFYAGYTTLMTRRRERRQRAVNEIDSRAQGMRVDSLLNVETIKTHSRQDFEHRRFAALQHDWVGASVLNQHALSALHIGQSAIIAGGVATVMLLAGQYTLEQRMSIGDLVLVNAYLIQLCLPLNALGFVFRQTLDALVDTERLLQLLRQPPEIADAPNARPLQLRGGEVRFEQVDFAYEHGRPILHDFSLALAPGQTVAVVGGSGSGKSTLARLLLRLYDPDGGRITLDGQDIRAVTLRSLRDAIGVVSQDTALFNESIAYNIAYGRPGAGLPEVIQAAQAAQVHEFIVSLPRQYDTVVGERGTKLSGGEKQRIAIARVLLKNPPLLIFDEATSALDTRAERAIQSELERAAQGRTTLIVAHRLSTIVDADHIVVMDKGRIVESGRHDALLAQQGLYAQLWNLQRQQREFERLERRLARQPVNLGALLAGTIDALRGPIEARRIALYTDIDAGNASVSGDPGVLSQVLYAIGAQAVRLTPEGGRIEIRLQRHDAQARLSVTDGRNAPVAPMPPRPRRRLLEPRTTEPDDPEPVDPLEVRSIIERQGGRFEVELPAGTHGMRSIIELPLRALAVPSEPPPADVVTPQHPQTPMLTGLTVMCIDDHADALESLGLMLQAEGARVMPFQRGAQALQWLEQHPPEQWPRLLVCDITLADGEDGHQLMRRIRQLEAQRAVALDKRLPAIALTGHAQAEDRLLALMAGFQLHLAKPVEPPVLVRALAALAGGA
ncbi:MAG: ATP-binding cassette domain-containing protein [Burkholderiaceae bacterium]|nr:ATP-binding cassette domain-containing protein [Burkholderiaceae bacterium]